MVAMAAAKESIVVASSCICGDKNRSIDVEKTEVAVTMQQLRQRLR